MTSHLLGLFHIYLKNILLITIYSTFNFTLWSQPPSLSFDPAITYENGFAKWKYVEVGLDNGVDIEILSGLNDGDQVIVSENLQLAHDAQVSIATEIGNNN